MICVQTSNEKQASGKHDLGEQPPVQGPIDMGIVVVAPAERPHFGIKRKNKEEI